MSDESIVNKIKKLLALAKSNNENESKKAYEKAMELMIKHNIETLGTEKKFGTNERCFGRETPEVKFVNQIILNCFFVRITRRRVFDQASLKVRTQYTFIGSQINLEVALYAFDFLILELRSMWKRAKKRDGLKNHEKESYYYGVYSGFCESYHVVKNYSEEKYQLTIPHVDPELLEWMNENMKINGTHSANYQVKESDALKSGFDDGKELKIREAVQYEKAENKGLYLASEAT